jgi:hypothetical protein
LPDVSRVSDRVLAIRPLFLVEAEFLRLDNCRPDHRPHRDPEGDKHVVAGDWRQPDFQIFVIGHELGRRPVPERAIRGRASLAEAKSLLEDGVGVLPLPMLEDELN